MKTIKYSLCVSAALLLSSCGIYTTYKPTDKVPENLYGNMDADTVVPLSTLEWKELFTDPQLQSLITKALDQNIDLRTSDLRVTEAEAALRASKLAFLPSFAIAPQGTVSSFDKMKAIQTYTLPLSASWEVDIFGRLRNVKKQSSAAFEQSKDYRQAVKTQVISSVANTYYTLLMLDEQLEISIATETSWKETVDVMRKLMNAGQGTEASVAQMEATYYSIQNSVLDLREQLNQVENAMCLLLGETLHHIERGNLSDQTFPENISVGLPVTLLSQRPDVRSAERGIEQAFYVTNQARAAFYPSLNLSGNVGWTNSAGSMVINPGKLIANAIGSLTLPLFSKGRNKANLDIAKAQQEEAALAFEQTLLNAGKEVNDAMTQYQTAKAKSERFRLQVEASGRAYRSTRLLMSHGPTTYLEVLTAQQTHLTTQLQQTANRFAEIQSIINLYHALGGEGIE